MKRTAWARLFVAALGAGAALILWGWGKGRFASGAAPPPEAGRENFLLITLDTTRADRIGCYGYAGAQTPALDKLAARGVLFENAYAAAPITLPSHATILTGMYPLAHGARNNGRYSLPESALTLVTEAPVTPLVVRTKSVVSTPVTLALNVTV